MEKRKDILDDKIELEETDIDSSASAKKKTRLSPYQAALLFIFLLLSAALIIGVIIITAPDDVPMPTPYNLSGNLMNGGEIAPGEGIMFYRMPDGGIYYMFNDVPELVSKEGAAPLFATAEGVVWMDQGAIYQSLYNGSGKSVLAESCGNPIVIGRWVYFVDSDGYLCKKRIDDGKYSRFSIKPGQYYISASRIFYLDGENYLNTCKTDGKDSERLTDYKIEKFMLQGNSIFFKDADGMLCYADMTDLSKVVKHAEADQFNYVSNYLIYTIDDTLYATYLTEMRTDKIADGVFRCLSVDSNFIFYFDADGSFCRMNPDGSELTVLHKSEAGPDSIYGNYSYTKNPFLSSYMIFLTLAENGDFEMNTGIDRSVSGIFTVEGETLTFTFDSGEVIRATLKSGEIRFPEEFSGELAEYITYGAIFKQ